MTYSEVLKIYNNSNTANFYEKLEEFILERGSIKT
jgi:hypothetical protein